jgi:serine/threonine-protein kinase
MERDEAATIRTMAFTRSALDRHLLDPARAAAILERAGAEPARAAEDLFSEAGIAAGIGEMETLRDEAEALLRDPTEDLLATFASLPLGPAARLTLGLAPAAPPAHASLSPGGEQTLAPPLPSGHPSDFEVLSPTGQALGAGAPPRPAHDPLATLHQRSAGLAPSGFPIASDGGKSGPDTIADFSPSDWASFPSGDSGRGSGELRLSKSSSDRFRVLRQHARGGLGAVSVAFDEELRREVALKEIREPHAEDAHSRARFLIEAEVTGGLEHPGVVPVYSLGRNELGRPFYAMRFIRGESLRKAIEGFEQEKATLSPAERDLRLRAFLRRFVDVCNALEYAHSRHVIHRDLKPDNIMLGPFGETLVVDWGLAKALDRPDAPSIHGEAALKPVTVIGTTGTVQGSILGTPQFMAPEQAEGATDTLGPLCDVYSLGATLYNILTGRPPFTDKNVYGIVEKVRAGTFPSPREVDPAIPAPLNAIVLKAMALRPADRYPSCRALADDIDRWLGDEPVSAFRDPWTVRLARWAKRHKTAVSMAAVLMPTVLVGLSVFTLMIDRERARTEVQKERAEENFETATRAIDSLLTEVGEIDLRDAPQMEATRRALLEKALDFYLTFLKNNSGRSLLRREVGRAHGRVGEIQDHLGQLGAAVAAFREAEKVQRASLAADPGNVDLREDLASTLHRWGIVLKKLDRMDEAEAKLREAAEIRAAIEHDAPSDPEARRATASSRYYLGSVLGRLQDRTDEARALYNQAIATERELAASQRPDPQDDRLLARYLNNLARLSDGASKAEARDFDEAIALQRKLAGLYSSQPSYKAELAWFLNNRAVLEMRSDPEAAKADLQDALKLGEELTRDHPLVPDYWRDYAAYLRLSGQLALRDGLESDAKDAFSRSHEALDQTIKIRRNLVDAYPDRPEYRQRLALALNDLGAFERGLGHPEQARKALDESVSLLRALVAASPSIHEYRRDLANVLIEDGTLRAQSGDLAGALASFTTSLGEATTALEARPGGIDYLQPRNLALRSLANLALLRKDPADASRWIADLQAATSSSPSDQFLCAALGLRALALLPPLDALPEADRQALDASLRALIATSLTASADPSYTPPREALADFTLLLSDPQVGPALRRLGLADASPPG